MVNQLVDSLLEFVDAAKLADIVSFEGMQSPHSSLEKEEEEIGGAEEVIEVPDGEEEPGLPLDQNHKQALLADPTWDQLAKIQDARARDLDENYRIDMQKV